MSDDIFTAEDIASSEHARGETAGSIHLPIPARSRVVLLSVPRERAYGAALAVVVNAGSIERLRQL